MSGARGSRRYFPEAPRRDRRRGRCDLSSMNRSSRSSSASSGWRSTRGLLPPPKLSRPASSGGVPIRPRVVENAHVLVESYRVLARAIEEERAITPAAEWLVDNFTIVDEQVREIRDDLPADYYRELPKVAEGHLAGYPRVLGLAWAYVAHTDSRFDPETLRRMVRAYQQVEPLTIGELWAIAISLRILLVENLRRLAERIVRGRAERQLADELADTLLGLGTEGPDDGSTSMRRLERAQLTTSAQVQLFQRLRDQDPAVTPALPWLERLVASQGVTTEELVQREHQRMATMSVTVRNVITSMRLISSFDWAEFVESVSVVDEVLRDGSAFGEMDFATRDQYRKAVEELARGSGRTEVDVARATIAMTANVQSDDDPDTSMLSRLRRSRLLPRRRWTLQSGAVPSRSGEPAETVAARRATSGRGFLSRISHAAHGTHRRRSLRARRPSRRVRSRSPSSPSARRPSWRQPSSTGPSPTCCVLGRCRDSTSMTACRPTCERSSSFRCCSQRQLTSRPR